MYRLDIRRDGKKHHVGHYKTKRERDKARVEWLLKYERGQIETGEKRTVDHAIDRWLEDCWPSYKPDSGRLRQLAFWRERLGHRPLPKLHRGDVADHLKELDRSPATVNRYQAAISAVLQACVTEWYWLDENPARGIKRRSESTKGAGHPFSRKEIEHVLQSATEDENRYFRALPVFLADTRCRLGEALKLQWSDVDLRAESVTFRDTKNGTDHVMPLTERVVVSLREVGQIRVLGDDRVFRLVNPYKMWRRCLERAGVPYRRIHDLRHSFGKRLADSGLGAIQIARMMNHQTLAMAKRYAGDADLELKRKALAAIR